MSDDEAIREIHELSTGELLGASDFLMWIQDDRPEILQEFLKAKKADLVENYDRVPDEQGIFDALEHASSYLREYA